MRVLYYKVTVLLESINLNCNGALQWLLTVSTDCQIRSISLFQLHSLKYPPNILALCWHSTLVYYVFYMLAYLMQAYVFKYDLLKILMNAYKEQQDVIKVVTTLKEVSFVDVMMDISYIMII